MIEKLKSFLQVKKSFVSDEIKTVPMEQSVESYYQKGKTLSFDVKKDFLSLFAAEEVLAGILFTLRNEPPKREDEKVLELLDEWYGNSSFLKGIRQSDRVITLIENIEMLYFQKELDTKMMILNTHRYKEKRVFRDDVERFTKEVLEESDVRMRMLLMFKLLEVYKEDEKSLNEFYEKLIDKEAKACIFFLKELTQFHKLSEENQFKLIQTEDKPTQELLAEKYPWLTQIYSFDDQLLFVLANIIATKEKAKEISLKHLGQAKSFISLKEFDKKLSTMLELLPSSSLEVTSQEISEALKNFKTDKLINLSDESQFFRGLISEFSAKKLKKQMFTMQNLNDASSEEIDIDTTLTVFNEWDKKGLFEYILSAQSTVDRIIKQCADEKFFDKPLKNKSEKNHILLLTDRIITAIRSLKLDLKESKSRYYDDEIRYLEFILSASKNVVNEDNIEYYALPTYKYLWLLEQKKDDVKIERFKNEHEQVFKSIIEKSDDSLIEKLESFLQNFVQDGDDAQKRKEMTEKKEIFIENFISPYEELKLQVNIEEAKQGNLKTLWLLAKYEAIKTKAELITKEYIEKASHYLCLKPDARKIFEQQNFNIAKEKIIPLDEYFSDALQYKETVKFNDEIKEFNKHFYKEEIYFSLFDGNECAQDSVESQEGHDVIEKEYTAKELILIAKYFAMKEKEPQILVKHLKQSIFSVDIISKELRAILPNQEGIQVRIDDIDTKIKEAQEADTIGFSDELKNDKIFEWLKTNASERVAKKCSDEAEV